MKNAERLGKAAQSRAETCAASPIDPEIAFCPEFSAACCVRASPGHSSGLKLGALALQAQTARMTRLFGPGGQVSLGEAIDTWMWIVSTPLD
jgi:hypothetical protein